MAKLKILKKKRTGRDNTGQVVVRHQGGMHKRFLRVIDFRREKRDMPGTVLAIEYDPNRTVAIALVSYADGEKRYVLAPEGLKAKDVIIAGQNVEVKPGNAMPLSQMPVGTFVHNIELSPGRGGQLARGAGTYALVSAREGDFVHLKLPSGELRKVRADGYGTIGQLGNIEWKNTVFGKAGRMRHRGIRPTVRGVAQNPRSHPHGGGEGRSGIGMPSPKTVYGRKAVGKTRRPKKYSNKYILERRKTKHG
ncbi:MAG: 50S ribosomal protein L2 [bacterium]|nr:50S ribosomal protein L2 [bacterium]